MHFHIADAYHDTGSRLHRMDARVKVVLAISLIFLISLTPMGRFGIYVAFFTLIMIGAVWSQTDPLLVMKRALIVLPFAGAAVTLVFTVPGDSLGTVPLVGWSISEPGLIRFMSIVFKSMLSVQVAVLLMVSTHFTDMLWALGALKMPRILVAIISFMYRYMFVLADEALRLTRARESRSASQEGKKGAGRNLFFQARSTGRLIGSLFLRTFERSERVYQAMVARGYTGEMKQLSPPELRAGDIGVAAIPFLIGVGLMLAGVFI